MDLMPRDTSAQRAPNGGGLIRRRLPFYSRFNTNGTAGVDVFSQNVNEAHVWVAPKMFWLLLPTTVASGSSVGAHK